MNDYPKWVTVAEAVVLTGRSKSAIYRITDAGEAATEDSTDGMLVNLAGLRRALAAKKRGRPRGTPTRRAA